MLGSSCRTVPAVAFRGFANTENPCFSRSSFIRLNDVIGMSISPRTSKSGGMPAFFNLSAAIDSGTERTVRTLAVTSSPVVPSPRVMPRTSFPPSKRSASDMPSSLSSQTYSMSFRPLSSCTRFSHPRSSSLPYALSSDSMGIECWILTKPSRGLPPTR